MIISAQPPAIKKKPTASSQNYISAPDGVRALSIKQEGKAATQYPFSIYSGTEVHPRMALRGDGYFLWSAGSAAPDTLIGRLAGGGHQFNWPATPSTGYRTEFFVMAETHPRIRLSGEATGGSQIEFGTGAAATDVLLDRIGTKTMRLNSVLKVVGEIGNPTGVSGNPHVPIWIDGRSSDGALLDGTGTGPQTVRAFLVRGRPINGTNGTRGNSITSDAANATDHVSFGLIETRNIDGPGPPEFRFDNLGSFHQMYNDLTVLAYSGGGDAYCEGFNVFSKLVNQRKGALVGSWESDLTIASGAMSRAVGVRAIVRENNAFSTYSSGNFGSGSQWIPTGARGFEAISSGGSQRAGTAVAIMGTNGWEYALAVLDTSHVIISTIDGLGIHVTKAKAGASADGDMRQPRDGALQVNTTAARLEFRSGAAWSAIPKSGDIVNADIGSGAAIAKTKLAALDVVNADVNASANIAESKLTLATDAAAGTGSRRTLGTGATQAAAGNDARFTKTFRTSHTFAIKGEITAADTVPSFYVPEASGQASSIISVSHKIRSGTSVTWTLLRNGSAAHATYTGGVADSTGPNTLTQTVALTDGDEIELDITAVSATPTDLTVTVIVEHVI